MQMKISSDSQIVPPNRYSPTTALITLVHAGDVTFRGAVGRSPSQRSHRLLNYCSPWVRCKPPALRSRWATHMAKTVALGTNCEIGRHSGANRTPSLACRVFRSGLGFPAPQTVAEYQPPPQKMEGFLAYMVSRNVLPIYVYARTLRIG